MSYEIRKQQAIMMLQEAKRKEEESEYLQSIHKSKIKLLT